MFRCLYTLAQLIFGRHSIGSASAAMFTLTNEICIEIRGEFGNYILNQIRRVASCLSDTSLQQLLAIFRHLPRLKECEGCLDLSIVITAIDAGKHLPIEFIEHTEIELDVSTCPDLAYEKFILEPLWGEQNRVTTRYLIDDLAKIVMEYSKSYFQQYHLGLLVAVYYNYWYLGKIIKIVNVGTIAFILVEYRGHDFDNSDWIPASSPNIKCFYNSKGKRIEQAEFLNVDDIPQMWQEQFIDIFDEHLGIWRQRQCKTIQNPFSDTNCASLGTFTL